MFVCDPYRRYATIRSLSAKKCMRTFRLGAEYDKEALQGRLLENQWDIRVTRRYFEFMRPYTREYARKNPPTEVYYRQRDFYLHLPRVTGYLSFFRCVAIVLGVAPLYEKEYRQPLSAECREACRRLDRFTVIHYHAIIHSALKYAVKTDMLVQNVADKVDRPKKNSFQPVFLSAEEMQKMFEALRGTKLELPVLVAAFYGFRRGEVLGLKWDAIDFERGTISVIRTVTTITVDGKQTEIEQQSAKTKSSLRTLPLIGSFREYFMQVKEAQELNMRQLLQSRI